MSWWKNVEGWNLGEGIVKDGFLVEDVKGWHFGGEILKDVVIVKKC